MKKRLKELALGQVAHYLEELLPPSEITASAACDARTGDLFFSDVPTEMAQAREICMTCEVRQICLEYYTRIENQGIAGGLTAAERRRASANTVVYSLEDVNEALDIQRDMKRLSASVFSKRYGITERTYYRWKRDLDSQELAS